MPLRNNQGQEIGMRHIREVLRLGLSCRASSRDIGLSLKIAHSTARKYLRAARELSLDWAKISEMNDEQLAVMVQARPPRDVLRPLPDFKQIHQDLKKPGVTLTLLWQEYKTGYPDGYQLSQFYQHYHAFTQMRIPTTLTSHSDKV